MQIILSYLKGILIGLMAGFPAGPLGAIALKEMISGEIRKGFKMGMGAVLANFIYGVIVTFGISFIASFLIEHQAPIRLIGSFFIILLGVSILAGTKKNNKKPPPSPLTTDTSFLKGFFISVTNPSKIFMYTGIISFMGLETVTGGFSTTALLLALGIATGSFAWWVIFVLGARKLASRKDSVKSAKLNLFFGGLIIALGIFFLINAVTKLV